MFNPKVLGQKEFSFTWGKVSLSVLFKSSPDWTRPTTLGRAICPTQSTDLKVHLIQKQPSQKCPEKCLAKYLGTLGLSQVDT